MERKNLEIASKWKLIFHQSIGSGLFESLFQLLVNHRNSIRTFGQWFNQKKSRKNEEEISLNFRQECDGFAYEREKNIFGACVIIGKSLGKRQAWLAGDLLEH